MKKRFTPPYPAPHKSKSAFIKRLIRAWDSWIHVVYEKSYTLKLGEIKMPKVDMYVVGQTSLVNKVFNNEEDTFPKHSELAELLKPLMGESVFTSNGENWKHQRSMLKKAFSRTHLKHTFNTMIEAADDLIQLIEQQRQHGSQFNIEPFMTHVAADIIYRTMFSTKINHRDSTTIYDSFHKFQINAQRAFILRLYRLPSLLHKLRANHQAKKIRHTFSKHIIQRYKDYHHLGIQQQADFKENDIFDCLLSAKHPSTQQHFTLEQIIDQLGVFFIAGHETSATTLSWSLYLIAKNPKLQQQLYEEINNTDLNNNFNLTSLKQLKTLNLVFKETLRLYPPVAFIMREASCDLQMRDKNINKGSIISISPWLIQRSSNHWKNPHEFDPARFDTEDNAAQQRCPVHGNSHKEAYLPFGKGERICMGAGFAQQEFLIVMSKILINYELEYTHHCEPEVISRVTTRAKDGILIHFKKRT